MRYRRFGKTELKLPVISCGGMRYQHKWTDIAPEEVPAAGQANLEATIRRAVDLGINHIETARGYGSSEMQLGRVLPKLPRDKLIVQTKVPPFADPAEFRATFEKSMGYLRLDHVDLLALHGINNRELLEWSLRPGGCLEAARQLQQKGRVRHIGFSTHATPDIIEETIASGEFDYVNLHWYFVNDLNWRAVKKAAALDMGVFIISPNDKGGKLYAPPSRMVELCAPLTPMQYNALYCLARPEVHTLSCGAARPEDFEEHLAMLTHLDHAAEMIAPIEARLRARMSEELGEEWCRRWPEGLPEYVAVPGEVNVVEILRLWTYAKSLDLVDWGRMRYNLLGQADHWFPGAKVDPARVDALTPCLRKSPFAGGLPERLLEAHAMLNDEAQHRLSQS